MNRDTKPMIVTCGLPYANGMAHLGHMRTYVPADIYVRSQRKQGREVVFICGSDTHGTPVVVNAEKEGITPKELVTIYHKHFSEIFTRMGVHFDAYGTTDDEENHVRTTDIVQKLIDNDYVYTKNIDIAYCPHCDRFLPDRYVEGICPHCEAIARGDECDQGCKKPLFPGELIDPRCTVCKNPAEYKSQEHYFFKLSEFDGFLKDYLEKLKGTDNAVNYAKGWVTQGLEDWCITRNMDWGVKFPGADGLVVYVWVDAPIGYIAFTEEWAKANNDSWEKFWKATPDAATGATAGAAADAVYDETLEKQNSEIVHFIGGDIVYHHCIFWPAMLKGSGYSLPTDVVASGMVKIEDKKFSKSRGYVVWVGEDYLDQGFHPDLLRYYLSSYTSHTKELNFGWDMLQEKINSELVAVLGNLFYRSLLFASKNFGEIPTGSVEPEILERIKQTTEDAAAAMEEYEFKKYSDTVMELASYANSYFQSHEPWALIKTDKEKCGEVVYNCLQLVKALTVLFEPVTPGKMQEAWEQLGLSGKVEDALYGEALVPLVPGAKLGEPKILFTKLEDDKISEMDEIAKKRVHLAMKEAGLVPDEEKLIEESKKKGEKMDAENKTENKTENKCEAENESALLPEITIDDFFKAQIKVGKILSAEIIEKSTKLYKIMVDVGEPEPRQIVSGIRAYYEADELVGKTVCVIVNLKAAKLCGVQSQGMILAADDGSGKVSLLMPDRELEPGSDVC
ncbi:Methionine--tRNA ligase [Methanimicrococcus hongohii]|uniref:Methionine--tRNA ligase n=2 Tax=Methanimicrococcus hongohii TaxID=3028295 RepID=A0AA96ZV43_9EURY|nr:methionine--tRNA ligase [Methanimicrococcus sp. Hf6]WNY24442.1 Methionine--tRNA ligase [Methanimicrococcus sp. Hf6]